MGEAVPRRGTPGWNILMQPRRRGRAAGRIRAGIEAIQTDLLDQLRAVDDEVGQLAVRREQIVADLRRCSDAFGVYGTRPYRSEPLPEDVNREPDGARPLRGAALREAIVDILRSAERPLTVEAIHRSLLVRGLTVVGRRSKAIPDALRTAVKRGDARRMRPGVYAVWILISITLHPNVQYLHGRGSFPKGNETGVEARAHPAQGFC